MSTRVVTFKADDGVELRCGYQASGKPRGWIVLIIPFGLELKIADAFFDFFSGDYDVACWESRLILSGNERDAIKDDFAITRHVGDLVSVCDALNIERAALVGYCSGAGIALAAVKADPQRFTRLVLVHGEFVLRDHPQCITQIGRDIDSLLPLAARDLGAARFILERVNAPHDSRDAEMPPDLDINRPFSDPVTLHRYALNYLAYRENRFEDLARGITLPTLVISGLADRHTNTESANRISSAIHASELHLDQHADHYGIVRYQSGTLRTIGNYLDAG